MSTARDLLADTRSRLMTGKPDRLNVLQDAVAANATTLKLQYELKGISEGTRLVIDLEEYHVLALSGTAAGSTVTVIPAMNGSVTTAHAIGSVIYVQPTFSDWGIAKHLNEALEDISAAQIFHIKNVSFDYNAAQLGYEITATDIIDVWRVKFNVPGSTQHWPVMERRNWTFDKDANTDDFPSGKALILRTGGFPGHKVHVSYKAKFTPLFNFATFNPATDYALDVTTTTKLHDEAHTLLVLDTAISMLSGREVKRTFLNRQPEPRRQEEVPVGAASQAIRPLLAQYEEALGREQRRLRRQYPEQVF